MAAEVAVLLSCGRHPVSGRSRMSPADAGALELALRLTPSPTAVHVGRPDDPALRDYLGMGLPDITVLEGPGPESDVLPPLLGHLRELGPCLVVAGDRAEAAESSGMLPYLLAHELGWPLLPQVIDLRREGDRVVAVRQLPGGRRHRIAAQGPAVVTVPGGGVATRHPAFGPARRGRIEPRTITAPLDRERQGWTLGPARARPPKLRPGLHKGVDGAGGQLAGLSPHEAAEQIYRFLTSHGVLRG